MDSGQPVGMNLPEDPLAASYGSTLETELLLEEVTFGDGYKQLTPTGLRPAQDRYPLRLQARPDVVVRAVRRFLVGEGATSIYNRTPAEWFWYQPPPAFQQNPGLTVLPVICKAFTVQAVAYNVNHIEITFEQYHSV